MAVERIALHAEAATGAALIGIGAAAVAIAGSLWSFTLQVRGHHRFDITPDQERAGRSG